MDGSCTMWYTAAYLGARLMEYPYFNQSHGIILDSNIFPVSESKTGQTSARDERDCIQGFKNLESFEFLIFSVLKYCFLKSLDIISQY